MATPSVFDLASAQRIAAAVRKVEIGDRSEAPLRFPRVDQTRTRPTFRVCTFAGSWSIGASKTVTFKYVTSTPNTATALNLFADVPTPSGATGDCAIAREGTAWFLIAAVCNTAT